MPDPAKDKLGKFRLTAVADAPDLRDWIYQPALVQLKREFDPPDDAAESSDLLPSWMLAAVAGAISGFVHRSSVEVVGMSIPVGLLAFLFLAPLLVHAVARPVLVWALAVLGVAGGARRDAVRSVEDGHLLIAPPTDTVVTSTLLARPKPNWLSSMTSP